MTQAVTTAVAVTVIAVKSSVSGVEAAGGHIGDNGEKDDLRQSVDMREGRYSGLKMLL